MKIKFGKFVYREMFVVVSLCRFPVLYEGLNGDSKL